MKKKVVQTLLEESDYEEFRKTSKKVGKTLREAAREAIRKWTEEISGISPEDPIFKIKPIPYGDTKASEHHDVSMREFNSEFK